MAHYKKPNLFHKIKMPVKSWQNLCAKNWQLIDNSETIIADNLTQEIAETLEQAINICPDAIDFTKFFVEWEAIIGYPSDTPLKAVEYRNAMYDKALEFMIELGLVEPPPTWIDGFPAWRDSLMENHYKVINKWP